MSKNDGKPFTEAQIQAAKLQQIANLSLKALDLATETAENWVYIQGNYVHEQDGKIEVSEVTDILIDSYNQVTAEKVNEVARTLFIDNQRRVNFKLCSQNHRAKKDKDEAAEKFKAASGEEEGAGDEDEECLGGEEIKKENEKAVADNKAYDQQMGLERQQIESIVEFQGKMDKQRYAFDLMLS